MFNPIIASSNIKNSFVDYISTTLSFSDQAYQNKFRAALKEGGVIAKGPYLEISGSYKSGQSLDDLIKKGQASSLFISLENVPEKEKELKIIRPLYTHQEDALLKANNGSNLVVTTGTGSGKTECFILPIINSLLEEVSGGTIDHAVRAIIIYPMNALANDQMGRLRKILASFPDITFGIYTGNTKHRPEDALDEYKKLYGNDPISNEILSREEMQNQPPHILITNYSMLEYMMLRPKDDAVFSGANLRYLVLDEAHIYRGATGIEMSMLMRRLRARISNPDSVQYILTSATLGGPESNTDILQFAKNLCSAPFSSDNIIRSVEVRPKIEGSIKFPSSLFKEIYESKRAVSDILSDYDADFSPNGDENEKIYDLILKSDIYEKLLDILIGPMTVDEIASQMGIQTDELVHFIFTASKGIKEGVSLMKARYHFFIRALEGIYISLFGDKEVYLTPVQYTPKQYPVFECAICEDCGRHALVGQIIMDTLHQSSHNFNDEDTEAFLIKNIDEQEFFSDLDNDDDNEENSSSDELDYSLCSECGKIEIANTNRFEPLCEHGSASKVKLRKANRRKNGHFACPACEFGTLRRGYLGYEAATGVLGTALYEQLPKHEYVIESEEKELNTGSNFFGLVRKPALSKNLKARQFLAFSDSRADAAFFASYMSLSFKEFLRRRGLWQTCTNMIDMGRTTVSVRELVNSLSRLFEDSRSFVELGKEGEKQTDICMSQSYLAIINELISSKRSSGLVQMGRLSFEYSPKNEESQASWNIAIKKVSEMMRDSENAHKDAKALLNLLILDAALSGAIDSESPYQLSGEEREYLFFSHVPKKIVKVKSEGSKNYTYGWSPRKRTGEKKSYYLSNRMTRVKKALGLDDDDASLFLDAFWDEILQFEANKEYTFSITDFDVNLYNPSSIEGLKLYKCKTCGRVTGHNCKNMCANIKCDGHLESFNPEKIYENNHYVSLYSSDNLKPFYIKEHTAQLSRDKAAEYQREFVEKRIHALSSSTTFEMGVDVGSLETVLLRNVPPSPANYVQRAGRAGRSLKSTAYALTYSKLSSHDFTYYKNPENMISGKISAPLFQLENEKIIRRHINAVALSTFFNKYPDMYDGDNRSNFLNTGGYELLKEYLESKPQELYKLLDDSIPSKNFGIEDWSWTKHLIGTEGSLENAVNDFRETVKALKKELERSRAEGRDEDAYMFRRKLREYRADKNEDKYKGKAHRMSLIDFLVRNNILPKYGFPVDTVNLLPDAYSQNDTGNLQMQRDLQYAVAEYAPGSEIVADGMIFTSRYIQKMTTKTRGAWEFSNYAKCPNKDCEQENFISTPEAYDELECTSCGHELPKGSFKKTIEPRKGFIADPSPKPARMRKPEKTYRTDELYIGDQSRRLIDSKSFLSNGQTIRIESTANDSLVVRTQSKFKVCLTCGYATGENEKYAEKHKTFYGKDCANTDPAKEYFLTHEFKTDVARITFASKHASDYNTMMSVLFALLESMAKVLDIERNDIKGTLYKTRVEGCGLIYIIIIYDAVGGGAGHSRRLVTDDGKVLSKVISNAVASLEGCDCEPSCYKCIRNYYNQKLHDQLDRRLAIDFLNGFNGDIKLLEEEKEEEKRSNENKICIKDKTPLKEDYEDWKDASILFGHYPNLVSNLIDQDIPLADFYEVTVEIEKEEVFAPFYWEASGTIILESLTSKAIGQFLKAGWKTFTLDNLDFLKLKKSITN